jgi:MFS family permease
MSRPLPTLEYGEKDTTISEGVWSAPYRRLTLGLTLIMLGPAFETLSVATILPKIVANLGGLSLYGWSFSAYMLATLVGLILAGDEADRRGPAIPFIFGVTLFATGLALAGTASSMITFVISRGVQGFGAGIIASVVLVCVGRGYPEQLKPRMVAVLSSAWVVPGLIGPALAGLVAEFVGWRWVFLGLVPIVPLATGMVFPVLRKLTPSLKKTRSLDFHRLLATAGLVAGAGMTLTGLQVQSIPIALVLILPNSRSKYNHRRYSSHRCYVDLGGRFMVAGAPGSSPGTPSTCNVRFARSCPWSGRHRKCTHPRHPGNSSDIGMGSWWTWYGPGLLYA